MSLQSQTKAEVSGGSLVLTIDVPDEKTLSERDRQFILELLAEFLRYNGDRLTFALRGDDLTP